MKDKVQVEIFSIAISQNDKQQKVIMIPFGRWNQIRVHDFHNDATDFNEDIWVNWIRFKNGVYILVEISFWISTIWWVSLLVDQRVSEGICSQVLRSSPEEFI